MAAAGTPPIPLAALEQHIAILGKTGSGKSFAAQGIVEGLLDRGERVCIVDPTDRYWGLRLLPDGKRPSKFNPVIIGGQYADMPLSAAHGATIGEVVGTTATPVIIASRLMTPRRFTVRDLIERALIDAMAEVVPGQRLDGSRDRPAMEPGGCECIRCECIFIGEEWHMLCAVCLALVTMDAKDG